MNKLVFYRNCFKQVAVLLDLVTVDKKKKKKKKKMSQNQLF